MEYSLNQIAKIKARVLSKVITELELAQKEDAISEFLDKYGIIFEEESLPVNTRTMKILVFGALAGKVDNYKAVIKNMGIKADNVVFENDYDRLSRYDVSKLEYSMEYSDIIAGPVPHSQKGRGDVSSFIALVKNNPNRYPRLIEARANDKLKITITNFKEALLQTRFMENID